MREKCGRRKKVGISSLSKKWVIRQAQSKRKRASGIHCLDRLELSTRFCEFLARNFVREQVGINCLTNQNF